MFSPHKKRSTIQGFAMLEAMVAVGVLAIGLLGLLGVHLRTLALTQDSANRLQAIRLIEDLSERLQLHPHAASLALDLQTSVWIDSAPTASSGACQTGACSAMELLGHTRHDWLANVFATLPQGQARLFATGDGQQLGVMLAWRSREGLLASITALLQAAPSTDTTESAGINCPAKHSCHLQHIQLANTCVFSPGNSGLCK